MAINSDLLRDVQRDHARANFPTILSYPETAFPDLSERVWMLDYFKRRSAGDGIPQCPIFVVAHPRYGKKAVCFAWDFVAMISEFNTPLYEQGATTKFIAVSLNVPSDEKFKEMAREMGAFRKYLFLNHKTQL